MTLEQHIQNWIAWIVTMSDDSPQLSYPAVCGSIEGRYPSPKNAGHGNGDVGELAYDIQRLQRQPMIVQDREKAEAFDRLVLDLPRLQFLVFRYKRLPKKHLSDETLGECRRMTKHRLQTIDQSAISTLAWKVANVH